MCFGVADGGLNEPLVRRDIAIHPPPVAPGLSCFVFLFFLNGTDHNNSLFTGEGEVKQKKKKKKGVGGGARVNSVGDKIKIQPIQGSE